MRASIGNSAIWLVIACSSPAAPPYDPEARGNPTDATSSQGTSGLDGAEETGDSTDSGGSNAGDSESVSGETTTSSSGGADGSGGSGGTEAQTDGMPLTASTTEGNATGDSGGTGGSSDGAGGSGASGGSADSGGSDGEDSASSADSSSADSGSGGSSSGGTSSDAGSGGSGGTSPDTTSATGSGGTGAYPPTDPESGPAAGNPDGECAVPDDARLEDTSSPDHVVGSGTPESCTADAFIQAVAEGGVITFDCGDDPVTITLDEPAKVYNDASDQVVIDGGGLVTLSGGGTTRILYMNTCDEDLVWTSEHCDNQEFPQLTLQNLTFVDGNSKDEPSLDEERDGGGAIWARGGRFKAINTRFFNNVCADTGPDVGGAVRVFSQYEGLPAYIVNSTFGGAEGYGNTCSNGGGISSIGVSWTVLNSVFSYNRAIGEGGNPAEEDTPGGGSGGAIYNDGQTMTLTVCGSVLEHNQVNAYGSAIFFVSNNHDGTLVIEDSTIRDNTGGDWNVLPSISMHEDTTQVITNSTIE